MAARAGNLAVLAQEWIFRLTVVVELGDRADGFPRFGNVAVLTRDLQIAVRAPCSLRLSIKRQSASASNNYGGD